MPFLPKPANLQELGGTDVKRTEYDGPAQEAKEALQTRWQPVPLVEEQTKGSFLSVTGTNSIQAKDPVSALGVTVVDRNPPGKAAIEGHDPYKSVS